MRARPAPKSANFVDPPLVVRAKGRIPGLKRRSLRHCRGETRSPYRARVFGALETGGTLMVARASWGDRVDTNKSHRPSVGAALAPRRGVEEMFVQNDT